MYEWKSDFSGLVPAYVSQAYINAYSAGKTADISNLERIIIYKLRTSSPEELREIPDVGQGLEYRILAAADKNNLDEIFMSIKTKRYTMARIKRILLNMLIGVKKSRPWNTPPLRQNFSSYWKRTWYSFQSQEYRKDPFCNVSFQTGSNKWWCRTFCQTWGNCFGYLCSVTDKNRKRTIRL